MDNVQVALLEQFLVLIISVINLVEVQLHIALKVHIVIIINVFLVKVVIILEQMADVIQAKLSFFQFL